MATDRVLGKMKVADIRHLIVENPSAIAPDAPVRDLLAKMIEDFRTRNVYVVETDGTVVGTVRMDSAIQHLFPVESIMEYSIDSFWIDLPHLGAKKVSDLMSSAPPMVRESTTLGEMARIMMHEGDHELAVVDEFNRLIGQVNAYEVIKAYLTRD